MPRSRTPLRASGTNTGRPACAAASATVTCSSNAPGSKSDWSAPPKTAPKYAPGPSPSEASGPGAFPHGKKRVKGFVDSAVAVPGVPQRGIRAAALDELRMRSNLVQEALLDDR